MKILYLSYDGLLESLGYSQVFQYLRELAKAHQICLITFEKSEEWDNIAMDFGFSLGVLHHVPAFI